jgi:hypothetical protein
MFIYRCRNVFTALLSSNGCMYSFHYTGFQLSCHIAPSFLLLQGNIPVTSVVTLVNSTSMSCWPWCICFWSHQHIAFVLCGLGLPLLLIYSLFSLFFRKSFIYGIFMSVCCKQFLNQLCVCACVQSPKCSMRASKISFAVCTWAPSCWKISPQTEYLFLGEIGGNSKDFPAKFRRNSISKKNWLIITIAETAHHLCISAGIMGLHSSVQIFYYFLAYMPYCQTMIQSYYW